MNKPLLVLALGGHGLSRPNERGYEGERSRISELRPELAQLAQQYRLLIVHGNGPQVGRLLGDGEVRDLDIHTAQTQGELGYLLIQALPEPAVALLTRVTVAAELGPAVKPIGPVYAEQPDYAESLPVQSGWRIAVPSPEPVSILEAAAIGDLLETHHVVAGGGGGVPLNAGFEPVDAVIDKDWVAAHLACALDAQMLVFATDVPCVYRRFDDGQHEPHDALDLTGAEAMLAEGLDAGSMAPKLASAAAFVRQMKRPACICAVEDTVAAVSGQAGTRVRLASTPV